MTHWAWFEELALCDLSALEPVADEWADGGAADTTRRRVPQETEAVTEAAELTHM